MSIIHDALKKVQQGLSSKEKKSQANPAPKAAANTDYIYQNQADVEIVPATDLGSIKSKEPRDYRLKSVLIAIVAVAITALSLFYIFRQLNDRIPSFQIFARKTLYKLKHKEDLPDFKAKAPEDLKPMAQILINAPGTPAATASTTTPPSSVTLNIHGIMANASGNLVLINDQVYQEGDEVAGAKILRIDLRSITVDINGNEKTIPVNN